MSTATWAPAVDIFETDKEIVMKAEIPEMLEKDIEIKVEDNVLTVSGERKMEKDITRGELPPDRALLRQLQPQLHPAPDGRPREIKASLQGRGPQGRPPQEGGGQAEADQDRRRPGLNPHPFRRGPRGREAAAPLPGPAPVTGRGSGAS